MKVPNIKNNSRLQVLIPLCAFVIVVVILLLIIIPSTADSSGKLQSVKTEKPAAKEQAEEVPVEQAAQSAEVSESTDSGINDFFHKYYEAMANGDAAAMDSMFDASGYAVTSEALASLLEGYENLRVYTAEGLHDNELAAFVYSDVKFKSIDTLAPSMDSFYLSTETGEPVILTAMYSDPDIAEYLNLLSRKNPVKSIMENTDFWLETTLQNDEALKNIFTEMQEYIEAAND